MVDNAISKLLLSYTTWENEELCCIHEFLAMELEEVFDRLERQYIERSAAEESVKDKSTDQEKRYSGNEADLFSPYDFHFSTAAKSEEDRSIDHLLSRGLNFLFNLLKGVAQGTCDQERVIVHSHGCLPKSFREASSVAMMYDWAMDQEMFKRDAATQKIKIGDLGHADEAYPWSLDYWEPETRYGKWRQAARWPFANGQDLQLRQCGYVFWDFQRLSRMGVLQTGGRQAQWARWGPYDTLRSRIFRPSAERVLADRGVYVSKAEKSRQEEIQRRLHDQPRPFVNPGPFNLSTNFQRSRGSGPVDIMVRYTPS